MPTICNHPKFTPSRPSEVENRIWDWMLGTYGSEVLAQKMARRKSYREYVSHWPYDHTEPIVSLEVLRDSGFDLPSGEDFESQVLSEDYTEKFLDTLTAKQRKIVEKLMTGLRPKDIYASEGYIHTGGIRYHKWLIRHLWVEQGNSKPENK